MSTQSLSTKRNSNLTPGIAFITGGARGLGLAVAQAFARDGAKGIAIIDIQSKEIFEAAKSQIEICGSVKVLTINCDVTKEPEVEKAVAQTITEFGRIDYAANFSGIGGPFSFVADTDAEKFKQVMDVNILGIFLVNKHLLRQMVQQSPTEGDEESTARWPQRGSIINCASVNSLQASVGSSPYTASKHAVTGITKAAALEARKSHVRVNSFSPGFIFTEMCEEAIKDGRLPEEKWKEFESRQGRRGFPDDIGDAVVLLSTSRMGLVNAHNLVADGGFIMNEWLD